MEILKNIAVLIKVKTIVTMVIIYVFARLSLNGIIAPDAVKDIAQIVIAFYFGTQFEKKVQSKRGHPNGCPLIICWGSRWGSQKKISQNFRK